LFNYYRKTYIENYPFEINHKLVVSTILISIFWILVYSAFGNYKNVYKKYRIKEITQTLSQSFIGIIFIFFTFLLDDKINSYQDYYSLITALIVLHISLTFTPRILLTSKTVSSIHQKKIGFNTILIGSEKKAKYIFNEINNLK
jgi:FlaA1/EpsC-like NDP-sugar epimerase